MATMVENKRTLPLLHIILPVSSQPWHWLFLRCWHLCPSLFNCRGFTLFGLYNRRSESHPRLTDFWHPPETNITQVCSTGIPKGTYCPTVWVHNRCDFGSDRWLKSGTPPQIMNSSQWVLSLSLSKLYDSKKAPRKE